MITSPWRILSSIALLCLWTAAAEAQAQNEPAAASPAPACPAPTSPAAASPAPASPAPISPEPASPASSSWEQNAISRLQDLFDLDLPKTEQPGQVQFSFQPHIRDLISKGYLRVPFEFRWGVNDHLELNSDIDTYFDNGMRKGNYGEGISELHFGAKYAWLEWLKPTWDTSVGFNSSIPVSRPPIELTDGHDHFVPYIVFGRKIDDVQGLSGLINLHVDLVTASSTPGNFGQNEPHTHSMTVSPGLLYDHDAWHYTLEVDGTTTRLIGSGSHDFLTIRPGVVWDLPKVLVFNSRGRWLAGFSLTFVFGPDGNTISTGGRFRGELDLVRWFGRGPPVNSPPGS